MIRCPRPGEKTPWDILTQKPKPPKQDGGLLGTIIDILTGKK